jgi:Ca2+-binding EF-hand superfamily protein
MTTELQLLKLEKAFDHLDVSANGELDKEDLLALGSRIILGFGMSPTSVKGKEVLDGYDAFWQELLAHADVDGDEALSPAEFRAAMINAYIDGNRFNQSFLPLAQAIAKMADVDNDGHVVRAEFGTLQSAFGTSADDTEAAFAALDATGKGKIRVDELVEAAREFYTSPDPKARGNSLFGPL